jgi:hypothetical protein
MKNALHGWMPDSFRPNPIVTFNPVLVQGRKHVPHFGDRHSLLLFKRVMTKKVSFARAYTGWKFASGNEEKELGQGRAFLRWLQKHELSIDWKENDFSVHYYLSSPDAPKHHPQDEMARDLSFAIRPVEVKGRKVKLYIQDHDMLSLLNLPYGNDEDFLELVMKYVTQRFEWETWRAPSPSFLDWVVSRGARPLFQQGQVGLRIALPMTPPDTF